MSGSFQSIDSAAGQRPFMSANIAQQEELRSFGHWCGDSKVIESLS